MATAVRCTAREYEKKSTQDCLHDSKQRWNNYDCTTTNGFFMDFVTAAQNAARTVFQNVSIKGCFFQLTQAIWINTRKTGLRTAYRNNADTRQLVRRNAILPLVSIEIKALNFV